MKLSITDGKLTLSVNNPDSGSASEELGVDYGFDPLEIGFNARYLLDISGQLEGGTAEFQLADPGSPTMIRDGKDHPPFMCSCRCGFESGPERISRAGR